MIRHTLLVLVSLMLFASISSAQKEYQCSHAGGKQTPLAYPDLPLRPYDVTSYDIKLDLRPAFSEKLPHLNGLVTITVKLTEVAQQVSFDAWGMVITGLTINDEVQSPLPQPDANEQLTIKLPIKFQALGTELKIAISYLRTSNDNNGAHFYSKGTIGEINYYNNLDTIRNAEDIFYTMSEARDAHRWMPCNDNPNDKAQCSVYVTVPNNGIYVTSNGILTDSTSYGSYKIFSYRSDKPIVPYLIAITASKFATWDEMIPRVWNPSDSIRLHYYAWQKDYDDTSSAFANYNAHRAFKNTKYMMANLERHYGPYPFIQYGQVPAHPFYYGGMEHQSMTTINRSWFHNNDGGIAHEMAHQWFGDKVTCATFKDLWLNEGFATFNEAIYNESWGGDGWYRSTMLGKANAYFRGGVHNVPIYDPGESPDLLFNGATVYNKAACVIHMLRRMVDNDTLFFNALRDYLDHFVYSTATTIQFRDYMGMRLNRNLDEFIDQWIFSALHPVYDIKWGQNLVTKNIAIRVNQTQDELQAREHFTMPIRFFAYRSGGAVDTLRFTNDARTQLFQTTLAGNVDSLIFDSDRVIISEHQVNYDAALTAKSEATPASFSVSIDATTSEIICRMSEDAPTLEIYNVLGERVLTHQLQLGEQFIRLNSSALSNGAYLVKCGKYSGKIMLVR